MLRDVFYYGAKPNVHPREQHAKNLEDARQKCTTDHFWIINEFCDYRNFDWDFDFEFLPDEDVWAEEHNNVWPSQHQKDSGTWLCPKEYSELIIYRGDVDPVIRKNEKQSENWIELDLIDHTKFDFSWHPDPTDPPYIYKWGCKFYPAEIQHVLEYVVPGATQEKYMNTVVELLPNTEFWVEHQPVDHNHFDFTWRPNPLDPPFIYVWGNKYIDGMTAPTLEYHMPGAIDKKHLPEHVAVLPCMDNWEILDDIDTKSFDFAWRPNPTSPPYIYAWGNQWNTAEEKISVQYVVPGATDYTYMQERAIRLPNKSNWVVPDDLDCRGFDFSWEPSPHSPPYIYEFATQWQKTGGPQYVVPGATEKQYVNFQKAKKLPSNEGWTIPGNIDPSGFDFSWHPDNTSPPYVYVFATQWAYSGGPVYTVAGATETKYIDDQIATAVVDMNNWEYNDSEIDVESFDFSWHPNVEDQPYIYQFGTQWQKTGGPRYVTPGADTNSPVKYIDTRILKANRLSKEDPNWHVLDGFKIRSFDYSWHPDDTEEPYIYVFGNTQYPAEECATIEYRVPGATQKKYVDNNVATLGDNLANWAIPDNIDVTGFDFSWIPNPTEGSYIYQFGTQWQKTGGPTFIGFDTNDESPVKYIDTMTVRAFAIAENTNWKTLYNVRDFDYSWHPDDTEEPYIYVFGNNLYPAEECSTVEYHVPGATQVKYIPDVVATLDVNMDNWVVPKNVDVSNFDFTWIPNPTEGKYIYQFGTQWQKTGGPKYIVPGAYKVKYVEGSKAINLPAKEKFRISAKVNLEDFDFSWHPDDTAPPYNYVFGNQWYSAEEMPTVTYRVTGATESTYINEISAKIGPNMKNWVVPDDLVLDDFDFSWLPHPKAPPYIYQFGTQWQKTGGPQYIVPGATEINYITTPKVTKLPNKENWTVPDNIDTTNFDFSWHPDDSNPPYIYVFATQWAISGGPVYTVPGATEIKYVEDQIATAIVDMSNWQYDSTIVDVRDFDFSWHPYAGDDPYIYQFGTQWQKTGGPRYIAPGANDSSLVKYIDTRILKAKRLPKKSPEWKSLYKIKNFDYSWHPDDTEEPYIYVFGNNLYPAEECPTVEYHVPGATQRKYIDSIIATLDSDLSNWEVPDDVDATNFDFSWIPNPTEGIYIYQFGTQWQKTGGPRYVSSGATINSPVKYIDTPKVTRLPQKSMQWETLYKIKDFDFSWHPDDTAPPYIYVFGNNWYSAEECATVRYVVPGATEMQYVTDVVAILDVDMTNWEIPNNVNTDGMDFSWIPHPEAPPYIYQFGTQWQKTGGPRYVVPGATETNYISVVKAQHLPKHDNWTVPDNIDASKFDFSWHPDDTSPPYIYVFATQWALSGGPVYTVPGATEVKYIDDQLATALPDMTNWEYNDSEIDVTSFDFSWHPYAGDDPYIYQFGTQWQKTGGPRYIAPGADSASPVKYIDTRILKATRLPDRSKFKLINDICIKDFDYSWHPDDTAPPYTYVFGNNWYPAEEMPTLEYHVEGATEKTYIVDAVATLDVNMNNWEVPSDIDASMFDFSWLPHPEAPAYIYQFGTQWQKTGGPRYVVPGATEINYMGIIKAKKLPDKSKFTVLGGLKIKEFDYSWHPDDTSPPYVYIFGNNWYPAEDMPTIEYRVEGATEAKFMTDIVSKLGPNMENWVVPEGVDVTRFDFSWIPDPAIETPVIYQFGTSDNPLDGPQYHTPGNTGQTINVLRIETEEVSVEETINEPVEEISIVEVDEAVSEIVEPNIEEIVTPKLLDVFFVDKGNPESTERFNMLKAKFGMRIQKTRYLNSWVDTINRCINRSTTDLIWILNSELDYTNFDFSYYPNMWQMKMVHVFGTQWSHWGTTFLVNRESFPNDTKYIKIIEHLSNLNFVKTIKATATACLYDVLYIDHGNTESTAIEEKLKNKLTGRNIISVKYDGSYLNTLRNHVTKLPEKKEHYLWICSSVCNYDNFDFSYICDPYAKENLHVFPSGSQKFGDTFLIDVNKTKEIIDDLEKLEEYEKVNYNGHVRAERLPEPIIITTEDTHVNSVTKISGFPYATVITEDNSTIEPSVVEPMNLWSPETKNIIVTSTGATRIVVPLEAKDHINKELYDYPYIKRSPKLAKSNPLDIVFLSNGEACADENYEHLLNVTRGLNNRVVRVDGVNGRAAAYHAAAEASETPWMFTVFAKLKVSAKFDWNWQPDRMQVPKHYIFHAKNPVNGLVYGHQAMIAYNKKLTLANEGRGLDFTLDDEHETVPLISGTAHYNTDPFSTWRTAFREVLKLKADDSEESRVRLDTWLNKAEGDFAQFSIKGAIDADEYYDEVNGDFEALKLSYEWAWLRDKFDKM